MQTIRSGLLAALLFLLAACFAPPPTPAWQIGHDVAAVDADELSDALADQVLPEAGDLSDASDLADLVPDRVDLPEPDRVEPSEPEPEIEAADVPDVDQGPCEVVDCDPASVPDLELGECERLAWVPETCACQAVAKGQGEPCDDGDPCTVEDACGSAGACVGIALSCDDHDPCTNDQCEHGEGCRHSFNTAGCDDGNVCTKGDACLNGVCVGGTPNPACGQCDPSADACEASWGDGDACNGTLVCVAGACLVDADSVVRCNDAHDSDCIKNTCDPETGVCAPQPVYDGAPCTDTNTCTRNDACHDGACEGVFDTALAGCSCEADPDCQPFENGNVCDGLVRCLGQQCLLDASTVVPSCDDTLDTTCRKNRCNPATGGCQMVDLPTSTACEDGNPCTFDDHCEGGQCRYGTLNECAATADACNVGVCLPTTGECLAVPAHEGGTCTLPDKCVLQARCASGHCVAWQQSECADDDPCTADGCDPDTGSCTHAFVSKDTPELCNDQDDDCDGLTDEDLTYVEPSGGLRAPGEECEGLGVCGAGVAECAPEGGVTCSTNADGSAPGGVDEACNGQDDDCDGVIDNGLSWLGVPVGAACDGVGACGQGVVECAAGGGATCSTNPGATASEAIDEICNGRDDDCDGATDDGLAPVDSSCLLLGVCASGSVSVACLGDAGWSCDYSAIDGYQAGDEAGRCDGRDNDCDGAIDEDFGGLGDACDGPDADLCPAGHVACLADGNGVTCADDFVSVETCDGGDNDCDGDADEEGAGGCTPYYLDADGDGFGAGEARCLCAADPDLGVTATVAGDCDDSFETGAAVNPDGDEACNGVDDDCDGQTDAQDVDAPTGGLVRVACVLQSGVCAGAQASAARCVDGAWQPCAADDYEARSPAYEDALEASCDGQDNDCDGATDEDFAYVRVDGTEVLGLGQACGRGRCAGGVTTCKADRSGVRCSTSGSAIPETCNGADDDCDGKTDADDPDLVVTDLQLCENQEGVCAGVRKPVELCSAGNWAACDALDYAAEATAYESGTEQSCDGIDNDCDGSADEDLGFVLADGTTVYGPSQPCGVGACAGGITSCAPDGSGLVCGESGASLHEICDGGDDDCDGLTDADDPDLEPAPCERQAGECAGAVHPVGLCRFGSWAVCGVGEYGLVSAAWQGAVESTCDGLDNDCDGAADDDFLWTGLDGATARGVGRACGTGACAGGLTVCDGGSALACSTEDGATTERCNGVDDDCDGQTDEDLDAFSADAPCRVVGACSRSTVTATCDDGAWSCAYDQVVAYEDGVELSCDDVDNDCDGRTDEDFALPSGATKGDSCVGGGCIGVVACAPTADSVACTADLGFEVCNDGDDDCDGQIDEGLLYREPATGHLHGKGEPCDGRGACALGVVECGASGDITCSTNPDGSASGALPEVCNGVDDDCDGDVDDGLTWHGLALYAPCDGDGACGVGAVECGVSGAATCSTNPDGSTPQAKPEACNAVDDDCDGKTDTADPSLVRPACELQLGVCQGSSKPLGLCSGGAWAACGTAAYTAFAPAYQAGAELSCDGLDNDCDGQTDEDFALTGPSGAVYHGAGVDCGVGACAGGTTVCRADQAGIRCTTHVAAAPERCNAIDDDCDGKTDATDAADLLANDRQACALQAGVCAGSFKPVALCQGGVWAACGSTDYLARDPRYQAAFETSCDGVDNDCDGAKDDDFLLTLRDGSVVAGVSKACGRGLCSGGVTTCNAAGDGITCPTEGYALAETCNGQDDDCDGLTDAADGQDLVANDAQPCANQAGVCAGAFKPAALCEEGAWGACTPAAYAAHDPAFQAGVEVTCDALDNDCDGATDEDFVLVGPSGVSYSGVGVACGVGVCAGGATVCRDDGARTTCSTYTRITGEACNGQDDDCDGKADAADPVDLLRYDLRACEKTSGVCAGATKPAALCEGGTWTTCGDAVYAARDAAYQAGAELACDAKDNDCDGAVDEDFSMVLKNGATVSGVGAACGVGACAAGLTACAASAAAITCPSEAKATPEVCDDRDNDCDGKADAADPDLPVTDPQVCALQSGVCAGARKPASLCANGAWGACEAATYLAFNPAYEAGAELTCDGRDNDCDGGIDDDFRTTGADGTVVSGSGRPCGVGRCAGGTTACTADHTALVCSSAGLALPETCNGVDDDCDGLKDAADPVDLLANDLRPCAKQQGVCAGSSRPAALCKQGAWTACTDQTYLDFTSTYEAAPETRCDGRDNDCDGLADEDMPDTDGDLLSDCVDPDDDNDTWLDATDNCRLVPNGSQADLDGDGQGDACDDDLDGDGDPNGTDCKPSDAAVRHGAPETCNAVDDDCDALVDASDSDLSLFDAPPCENQKGACSGAKKRPVLCVAGAWSACGASDYAAWSLLFQSGVETACDGQDNDCDGATDDDFTYTPAGGGATKKKGEPCGTGACTGGTVVCNAAGTGLICSTDTGAGFERCDGIDNDCDGKTDGQDPDLATSDVRACEKQAGVCAGSSKPVSLCVGGAWQPCADATYTAWSTLYRSGTEPLCDGVDNDCDGAADEDFSFVGLSGVTHTGVGVACGVGACAGGQILCKVDKSGTTCSTYGNVAHETCDNLDNDCDGKKDAADTDEMVDGFLRWDQPLCANQAGVCQGTKKPAGLCQGGQWQACTDATYDAQRTTFDAGAELTCDGLDNDCNGAVDEDFAATLQDGRTVWGAGSACGAGLCQGGVLACTPTGQGVACSTEHLAVAEVCNGLDDDCDGKTDAADPADLLSHDGRSCEKQQGVCAGSTKPAALCVGGAWQPCVATTYGPTYQGDTETTCDAVDGDCDGQTDEDFAVSGYDGTVYHGVGASCGVGACSGGTTTCLTNGTGIRCPTFSNATNEVCNGFDDDCDGMTDTADTDDLAYGYFRYDVPACELQAGVCLGSLKPAGLCVEGAWGSCGPAEYGASGASFQPGAETACDGRDNDCDGQVDEDFLLLGPNGLWYVGAGASCGVGNCSGGLTVCNDPGDGIVCTTAGKTTDEGCDDLDNDCDGLYDEGCDDDGDGWCDDAMAFGYPRSVCPFSTDYEVLDCDDSDPDVTPYAGEVCDTVDNDCNGAVDEGCDDDGDGYCDADMIVAGTTGVCPNGVGDCCDIDTGSHPDLPVKVWFTSKNACNSWNWDCDKEVLQQYPTKGGECTCSGTLCKDCLAAVGWAGATVPPCGAKAPYVYAAGSCSSFLLDCVFQGTQATQGCR